MTNVFVYGTLRKGGGNFRLLETSKLVGNALTVEKYAMFASGIPYVVEDVEDTEILGEVYDVDDLVLRRLDQLEGHPRTYNRRLIKVCLENGKEVEAYIYFYDHLSEKERVGGGRWMKKVENGDFFSYAKPIPERSQDRWYTLPNVNVRS